MDQPHNFILIIFQVLTVRRIYCLRWKMKVNIFKTTYDLPIFSLTNFQDELVLNFHYLTHIWELRSTYTLVVYCFLTSWTSNRLHLVHIFWLTSEFIRHGWKDSSSVRVSARATSKRTRPSVLWSCQPSFRIVQILFHCSGLPDMLRPKYQRPLACTRYWRKRTSQYIQMFMSNVTASSVKRPLDSASQTVDCNQIELEATTNSIWSLLRFGRASSNVFEKWRPCWIINIRRFWKPVIGDHERKQCHNR